MIEPSAADLLMQASNAGLISREECGAIGRRVRDGDQSSAEDYTVAAGELAVFLREHYAFGVDISSQFDALARAQPLLMLRLWLDVRRELISRQELVQLCCRAEDVERAAQILLARAELRRPEGEWQEARFSGWTTVNEERAKQGLPALPDGDKALLSPTVKV